MKSRSITISVKSAKPGLLTLGILFCVSVQSNAIQKYELIRDTTVTSTHQQAIEFIDKINQLAPNTIWPNIKPALFLQNLKTKIRHPVSIYPGNGTNFCWYVALTYLLLLDGPLGYAKLLIQLYKEGKSTF